MCKIKTFLCFNPLLEEVCTDDTNANNDDANDDGQSTIV